MAKLRKPRPSTSSVTSPDPPSPRKPPSIASSQRSTTSTSTPSAAPIALRSASRKSLASVVAPSLDAAGEFVAPEGGGIGSSGMMMKSSSSTHSIDSIPRSPISTKSSRLIAQPHHSRNDSSSSTSTTTNSIPFPPPTPVMTTGTTTEASSALSQLRQKLDSDLHARESQQQQSPPHKLRKKHKKEPDHKSKEGEGTESVESRDGEGEITAGDNAQKEEEVIVETLVMQVVEETEELLENSDETLSDRPQGGEEEEAPSTHFSSRRNTSPSTSSSPPVKSQDSPPPPSSIFGNSVLFAPARIGWRLTTGTVQFGFNTSKAIFRQVPIVGRLVPHAAGEDRGEDNDDVDDDEVLSSLPSPPSSQAEFEISFAPSTASALQQRQRILPSSPSTPPPAQSLPPPPPTPKTFREEEEEHGLVYKAAELSLGIGIAGVLVTSALGKMAWRKVVTGSSLSSSEEINETRKR